jgi:hypothetical protein
MFGKWFVVSCHANNGQKKKNWNKKAIAVHGKDLCEPTKRMFPGN